MQTCDSSRQSANSAYSRCFFLFSVFAMVWATLLLYAGAYTTSIQAGMVFLDWPLSNSSINPDGWLSNQDMMAEHSHRLLGAKLGLLGIAMVAWTQLRRNTPRTIKVLAIIILAAIITQGLFGGLRVLLDKLNTGWDHNFVARTFAVLHACGAQITVCLLTSMAVLSSRSWIERNSGLSSPVPTNLRIWGIVAVASLFIQILLGAIMRHSGAGLAISTFPLTENGGLLPSHWNFPITIHWLHRLGAVIPTLILITFTGKILGSSITRRPFRGAVILICVLLPIQIFLGAATIWTYKNPVMASNHMVFGAFLLGATWMLTLRTYRLPLLPSSDTDSAAAHQPTGEPAHT
jgi:cytochrome c oxidase assembly protein subunit 15